MEKKILFLFGVLFILYSCGKVEEVIVPDPKTEVPDREVVTPNPAANLLFSSGFEDGTVLCDTVEDGVISENYPGYKLIKGTDSATGYSWPPDVLGSTFGGLHIIDDDGGAGIDNEFQTVVGHTGEETTAFFQRINYNSGFTQAPYQINNIARNPDELYTSFWMKIDATSVANKNDWRAIWEYKTYDWDAGNGFRMVAFIERDEFGVERWRFQGDSNPNPYYWAANNYEVPVPREEWFKVEVYFKWSTENGYASMKVNGEMIAENFGPTTYNNDDLGFLFVYQIYGSSTPMHQWVDDVEIWDARPFQ